MFIQSFDNFLLLGYLNWTFHGTFQVDLQVDLEISQYSGWLIYIELRFD